MPSVKTHHLIRRTHRFLGVCIGIQFIAWTIGGLYFSWSDMDEVHGDYDLLHVHDLPVSRDYISPSLFVDSINSLRPRAILADLKLIKLLDQPYWQATFEDTADVQQPLRSYLCHAVTGESRLPLTEAEATSVAMRQYLGKGKVESVEYLNEASSGHEYREQPLPAYAVTFDDARHTTIYVASELGVVTKARNKPWRQFDFLWMLHTMGYEERDNISNWLLRVFSIFGLITVVSGFVLFFVSRKRRI